MIVLIYLALCSFTFGVETGISFEIERFKQDIESATPALEDAMTAMKADFVDNLSSVSASTSACTWISDTISSPTSAVKKIVTGWNYGSSVACSALGELASGDIDNGFVVQITFQDTTNISPVLRNRTVTFIAQGLGPDFDDITSASASAASPLSASDMSAIGGFRCLLKTSSSQKPGYLYIDTDSVNLFNFVKGPFSLCKFA